MNLNYTTKTYTQLALDELYDILTLRQEVFVVEQDCPYLDADGKDQASLHVCGRNQEGKLLSYARIVPKGISYPEYISIGRVIVSEAARGTGEGIRLMEESIKKCRAIDPAISIKISAQSHLQKFYGQLGFVMVGEGYLEDGIPHVGMVLKNS